VIRVESADPTIVGVGAYLAEFLAAPLGRRLSVSQRTLPPRLIGAHG